MLRSLAVFLFLRVAMHRSHSWLMSCAAVMLTILATSTMWSWRRLATRPTVIDVTLDTLSVTRPFDKHFAPPRSDVVAVSSPWPGPGGDGPLRVNGFDNRRAPCGQWF